MEKPSINQLLSRATALYHSGDYQEAILLWEEILQSDPENQQAQEGIKMASLLLEEAQAVADAAEGGGKTSPGPIVDDEDPRIQKGIEQVQGFLADSRHLEAIEVCRSLLNLSPQSRAVHEILEEARDAYESQPFITEHLEIARELFVQERLDEALAECQKIFFLNPNHAPARKLQAKIDALKKRSAAAGIPTLPPTASAEEPSTSESAPHPSVGRGIPEEGASEPAERISTSEPDTLADTAPLPIGDMALPEEPAPEASAGDSATEDENRPVETPAHDLLNEHWEEELPRLDTGPPGEPGQPGSIEEKGAALDLSPADGSDDLPLMNIGESPSSSRPEDDKTSSGSASGEKVGSDVESHLGHAAAEQEVAHRFPKDPPDSVVPVQPSRPRPVTRSGKGSGTSLPRLTVLILVLGLLGGAAYWYFFLGPNAASGQSSSGSPPSPTPPAAASTGVETSEPAADQSQPGISGTTRGSHRASVGGTGESSDAPADSADKVAEVAKPVNRRVEIDRLWNAGRAHLDAGDHIKAAELFNRVLELDPTNIEAKSMLDQAVLVIREQERIEKDLKTARQYFEEQDYESALKKLYRLPRDQGLGDIDLFIRNSWYNWGLLSLKGGNCANALKHLGEVLVLDPNDLEAKKQIEVAEKYNTQSKDRVFYAYVDGLVLRTIGQK